MPTPSEIEKMINWRPASGRPSPRNRKIVYVIIAVLIILIVGGGIFFLQKNRGLINISSLTRLWRDTNQEAATENGDTATFDVGSIVACGQAANLADYNSDIGLASDNTLLVVNYDTITRYRVRHNQCEKLWSRGFMSDDQQLVVQGENLWVASRSHDVVGKFRLSDGKQLNFSAGGISMPRGFFPRNETLYVAEFEGSIKVFNKQSGGLPSQIISTASLTNGQFVNQQLLGSQAYLYDLVVDNAGQLYVLYSIENVEGAQLVAKLNADGQLLNRNFIRTQLSTSLYIDAENNLYLMDSDEAMELPVFNVVNNQPIPSGRTTRKPVTNLIKKYSLAGQLLKTWRIEQGYMISSFTLKADKIIAAAVKYDESGESKIQLFDN